MTNQHTPDKITIQSHDGGSFSAHIALPTIMPAPVVILIQEIFGVNQEMIEKCEEMATAGYIAICPDLFWRIEPGISLVDSDEAQLARAFELFGEFDVDLGLKDLQATLAVAKAHSHGTGKAGCVGYCLGGKLAYMMAARSDIDAAISYYGVGIETMLDEASAITKPLLMHIAGADEFVPPEAQSAIQDKFIDVPHVNVHHYEGMDHAFARGNGTHYNQDAARLANSRTAEFLLENL